MIDATPTEPAMRVLIVEDEAPMRRFIRAAATSHGYTVFEAPTAAEAERQITVHQPNIILLDLGLPDEDGLALTQRLREWTQTPIIVLSARGREDDKVAALDAGADDYLTKPFGVSELLARMRVALRHAQTGAQPSPIQLTLGAVVIDVAKREVTRNGTLIHLTPTEYRMLALLVKHIGLVLTHRQILLEVWGPANTSHAHYVRVHMAELRKKLEDNPARPRWLVTEPGVGYRLRAE